MVGGGWSGAASTGLPVRTILAQENEQRGTTLPSQNTRLPSISNKTTDSEEVNPVHFLAVLSG
jgi:hypothetical protein